MDRKWWTLLAVCAGTFMLLLDVTIVVVALPQIEAALHANLADVQWVVDAYALTLASLLLTAGVLADRYGRRLLFAIGLSIFTLGSLTCGLAQSTSMLIVSRAAQGVGGAIMFATSLALLGHSFRGRDRGVAFGVWGAITGVAVSLGPILGGLITTDIDWRGIFLVNVPVGVLALAVTWWRVEESRASQPGRPDWTGFGLLTTGLVGVVYGLIRASESSWSDSGVIVSLVAGAVLLVAFVVAELRVPNPMFDLSLFRTPTFTGGLIAALTMNGSLFAMFLYLVIYLQDVLGLSALATGLRLLVSTGAMFVTASLSGRLSERVPVRWLIGPGLTLTGIGLLIMDGLTGADSWTHFLPGLLVSGFGSGLVNPPLASTAIGVVEPQRAGMASGVNSTFRQIGFAMAIAAFGSVFASTLQRNIAQSLASVPALGRQATRIVPLLRQGDVSAAIAGAPPAHRAELATAIRSGFAAGINDLVVIAGVIALAGAVCSFVLIRRKDFVARHEPAGAPAPARTVVAPAG
jgi:EmrB/QacA subfamily drug resistance transporter